MIHLLYHSNCADGFAAACIARHALLDGRKPSPDNGLRLYPVSYEKPMPLNRDNTDLFDRFIFVDFTPTEKWISGMTDHPSRIKPENCTIIDHHKTKADVHKAHGGRLFTSIFDISQSGAMLTWQHFFGVNKNSHWVFPAPASAIPQPPLPLLLLQHYDLGGVWDDPRHPLTNQARWLGAYLMRVLPRNPETWTPILLDYDQHQTRALEIGARLHASDQRLIRALVKAPHWVNIGGLEVPALNGLPRGLLNDAVNELLIEHPDALFAAAWSVLHDSGGVIKWSLRSRKNGFDCAALCQTLDPNGGGHPHSAGFSTLDPVQFV